MTISFSSWLRATWLGWLLGVPVIALLALAGEAVGIGGTQVLVGLGMGLAVGLVQSRRIRELTGRAGPWIRASSLGLAAPFLVSDLAAHWKLGLPYSLAWCVVIGGALAGVWQAILLRPRLPKAAWWAAGSAIGWALAAGSAALANTIAAPGGALRGIVGLLVYLGTIALGGGVLGAAEGFVLLRLQA
jgi:hypothetical protein